MRCKITVLKKMYNEDMAKEYRPSMTGPCDMMEVGDVFYTTGPFGIDPPENLCPIAWESIGSQAVVLASGGKVFGKHTFDIEACNDGFRPVIFKLEACE